MDIRKRTNVKRFSVANLCLALLLIICSSLLVRSAPSSKLEQIRNAGELRVLWRNGPISHYQSPNGLTGFEYTLLKGFADDLGVKLVIENEDHVSELLQKANDSSFDLISPSAITNQTLQERFRYGTPFTKVGLQLVYNNALATPTNMEELAGKTILLANKSSIAIPLQQLQQSFPNIHWELAESIEVTNVLDQIERGTADYAIVDSAVYSIHHYSYPHAEVAFNVNEPQSLAWAFSKSRDNTLYDAAQKYLNKINANGKLAEISAYFFNQFIDIDSDDAMMFSARLENRFPAWEASIKKAASEYNVNWQMLAAIGYQESQWNPGAQSPTGVRGFMMLVPSTAKELGVQDLEDPTQSIYGGAKYLRYLLDVLPEGIQGEDRTAMALAAYNQGIGHLEDARVLTEKNRGNPNSWIDVSANLPLLSKPEFYSATTYGFARGGEAVAYVKNVMSYQRIIDFKVKQQEISSATSHTQNDSAFAQTPQEKSALEKINHTRLSSISSISFL